MGVLTCFDSWVLVMSLRELFSVEVRVTPKKMKKSGKQKGTIYYYVWYHLFFEFCFRRGGRQKQSERGNTRESTSWISPAGGSSSMAMSRRETYVGFYSHGDTPIAGWFSSWNILL